MTQRLFSLSNNYSESHLACMIESKQYATSECIPAESAAQIM